MAAPLFNESNLFVLYARLIEKASIQKHFVECCTDKKRKGRSKQNQQFCCPQKSDRQSHWHGFFGSQLLGAATVETKLKTIFKISTIQSLLRTNETGHIKH